MHHHQESVVQEEEEESQSPAAQGLKEEEEHSLSLLFKLVQRAKGACINWFAAVWKYSKSLGSFECFWDYLFNKLPSDAEAMSYIQNCLCNNTSSFNAICKWARSQIDNFKLDADMQHTARQFCHIIINYLNHSSSLVVSYDDDDDC